MPPPSSLRRTIIEQQQTSVSFIDLRHLDWEGYVSRRSSSFRKQIRRGERVLVREHAMRLRGATEDTLEADIAEL